MLWADNTKFRSQLPLFEWIAFFSQLLDPAFAQLLLRLGAPAAMVGLFRRQAAHSAAVIVA